MAEKFPTPQERAMAWLLEAQEIGGMSRPETALYAYQHGWQAAIDTSAECSKASAAPAFYNSPSTAKEQTMSSEKPFWEGKTCEEMANLHVKVTFVAGAVLTGITDCSGHIRRSRNGSIVPISANRGAKRFVPYRDIESIELLDDPEYERIDNIEDVREGDVYVGTDGNRYTVLRRTTSNLQPLTVAVINTTFYPHRSYFAYALRRKPKLPDHDGLWWDKDNALWSVAISGMDDSKLVALLIGDPESPVTGSVWSGLNSKHVTSQAPFRPAKAVEA